MDRSSSRSPPPMPPSSSILGNTVSSSVLFFNKNKSSSSSSSRSSSISRSGSIKSKKSARFQSDLGKSGSIISNYDDGSTIEDADVDRSTSHGEFYVTANSNPSSSRGSLEEEDSNGSGTSSFSRLYNSTTSAFKRSFNFFEGMGHSEKGSSSNNSNNNSSQNSSSSNLSLGNSDARQQSSSLDQNNTFLLPPIWYHSNTAASFPFFPSSLSEKPLSLSNFVNHLQRKIVKSGFELTMMVIGEARLGKSTLVNSIFKSDIFPSPPPPPSSGDQHEAKQEMTAGRGLVETTTIHLIEHQVDLHLTLLEVTPNFGESSEAAQTGARSVAQLIEGRFLEHLNTQSQVRRSQAIADKRVNACLYLVPPTGLTPGDVQCMLELHDKVNIIPVIAKADTLTPGELEGLKKSTMVLISGNHIKLYDFPEWAQVEASHEELLKVVEGEVKKIKSEKESNVKEDAVNEQAESLDPLPPPSQPRLLAVIGSNEKMEVEGKLVRIRRYPWGVVEVESPHHCDLITLRRQLMHHLLDLREVTDAVFYDNFRKREYLLQKEIRERQSTLDSLQAHYLQELERLEEEHLTRLCQMEMDEVCYLERENEAKWQLQKDIAQLVVKKRKLEAGEEVDGEEQENVPPGANQGHTPGNGKNTIPKEKITPRTLGGALRELGSDIQRISSFKTPKPLRHLFSPSTNGGKEKRKTSNGF